MCLIKLMLVPSPRVICTGSGLILGGQEMPNLREKRHMKRIT